jgi:hypothetical protein
MEKTDYDSIMIILRLQEKWPYEERNTMKFKWVYLAHPQSHTMHHGLYSRNWIRFLQCMAFHSMTWHHMTREYKGKVVVVLNGHEDRQTIIRERREYWGLYSIMRLFHWWVWCIEFHVLDEIINKCAARQKRQNKHW